MTVKLTPNGEKLIQEQISNLEAELKNVRFDKNKAVRACGEDKLANPLFHKLEQEEQKLDARINDIRHTYHTAERIQLNARPEEKVAIGAIVTCRFIYPDFQEDETYEIVGYGESDVENNKLYYETPVAKSLIGLKPGDETSLDIPSGKAEVKVLALHPDWDSAGKH